MNAFHPEQHGRRVADLINLERLQDQLIRHEGLRLLPYRCPAGKLTIGVGRNIEEVGISEAEAMVLLANDISRVIGELQGAIPAFAALDEIRRRALVDMGFNLGLTRLLRFQRLLAALEARDFPQAAAEMLDSHWARQVGDRAARLAAMMATGAEH